MTENTRRCQQWWASELSICNEHGPADQQEWLQRLPKRVANTLWRNGYHTPEVVQATPYSELRHIRGLGTGGLAAIRMLYPYTPGDVDVDVVVAEEPMQDTPAVTPLSDAAEQQGTAQEQPNHTAPIATLTHGEAYLLMSLMNEQIIHALAYGVSPGHESLVYHGQLCDKLIDIVVWLRENDIDGHVCIVPNGKQQQEDR